jgi:hypothetical protein
MGVISRGRGLEIWMLTLNPGSQKRTPQKRSPPSSRRLELIKVVKRQGFRH